MLGQAADPANRERLAKIGGQQPIPEDRQSPEQAPEQPGHPTGGQPSWGPRAGFRAQVAWGGGPGSSVLGHAPSTIGDGTGFSQLDTLPGLLKVSAQRTLPALHRSGSKSEPQGALGRGSQRSRPSPPTGHQPARSKAASTVATHVYFDYLNVLLFASVGLVFVFANLLVASLVRPSRSTDEGLETYECGEEAIGDAWIQFDIRYYTVALVYVVFAVEIAFLFPWALVLRESFAGTGAAAGKGIGLFALVEGLMFVTILFLGLVYVWVKGDLDWVLTYTGQTWEPKEKTSSIRVRNLHEIEAEREAALAAAKEAEAPADTGPDEAAAVSESA